MCSNLGISGCLRPLVAGRRSENLPSTPCRQSICIAIPPVCKAYKHNPAIPRTRSLLSLLLNRVCTRLLPSTRGRCKLHTCLGHLRRTWLFSAQRASGKIEAPSPKALRPCRLCKSCTVSNDLVRRIDHRPGSYLVCWRYTRRLAVDADMNNKAIRFRAVPITLSGLSKPSPFCGMFL